MTLAKNSKVTIQGKKVPSTELEFSTVREDWNEYSCEDGSTVRIKLVATKIHRLDRKDPNTGDPVYLVRSSNVVDVITPTDEEEVH